MMLFHLKVLASAVFTAVFAGPIVHLKDGTAEGILEGGGVAVWRGIPFAAPPVGDLRWRPPQPSIPWGPAVFNASRYSSKCMQSVNLGRKENAAAPVPPRMNGTSEDCLYLNVFAPSVQPESPLPVLFWIHGGGYNGGGSSDSTYDARYDVALLNGTLIVVTVNYRMAIFGFAASELLRARDPDGGTGNYGLLDQRLAMRWVQNNIAAFGGDPSRVLIVGESAGADSVAHHLVMPKSWGLFSSAGVDSGAFYAVHGDFSWHRSPEVMAYGPSPGNVTVSSQEGRFALFLKQAGCDGQPDVIGCLIALPEGEILSTMFLAEPGVQWQWVPVVDGVEVMAPATLLAASGKLAPVPVIVGSNMEDVSALIEPNCGHHTCEESDFREMLSTQLGFGAADVDEAVYLYGDELPRQVGDGYNKWYTAELHIGADNMMTCPSRRLARWVTQAGQNAYWYYFSYPPKLANGSSYPTCHSCELPSLFLQPSTMHDMFSISFLEYWANFARAGTPTGTTVWPIYDRTSETALAFGEHKTVEAVKRLRGDKCDFWDRHMDHWGGVLTHEGTSSYDVFV